MFCLMSCSLNKTPNGTKLLENKEKLTFLAQLKVNITIFRTDILVQTAPYMSKTQLHLHRCNNELMNPGLLENTKRLESI